MPHTIPILLPAPYPSPYPHAPPPGHPVGHAQPGLNHHASNGSLNGSETASVASSGSKQPKTTSTAAQSTTKTKKDSKSSSETSKTSSAPKAPKTFRFEGSISSETFKTTKSFDLAGVNILNRKPLDTKTALDKLQRRRETHNRVERKRRDCINQLIDELTSLLPPKHLEEVSSKCHRVNVLRGAVSHIKFLNESNDALAQSIRSIQGDDAPLPVSSQEKDLSMDVDKDEKVKIEDADEGMDNDGASEQDEDSSSRSTSPAESSNSAPSTKESNMLAPPPVIITDAPNTSTDNSPRHKASDPADPYSLASRPRSNSFASSIGDMPSPASGPSSSPLFLPSPVSPMAHPYQDAFPPGEDIDGSVDLGPRRSSYQSLSASPSPSLPPISSLANMHLQSPPGETPLGSGPGHGRSHRAGTTLPPLMIPEPHNLHPSYQGANSSGGRSGTNSNRTSLTLSPHSAEHPPISPFMLSPMLSRSPSMGPVSSTPGSSPYPHWGHDGTTSPQPYPPYGYPHGYNGYSYPGQMDASPAANQLATSPPTQSKPRPKSLQPEPIFIQEEPWNVQRKRSSSNVSGRPSKASTQDKKKASETSRPVSPASSITSTRSRPTSPNPKKRAQIARYDEGEDGEADAKRSKQVAQEQTMDGTHQRDSGVAVVIEAPGTHFKSDRKDEDAAQALTSLAQAVA
ncbi:hypothetical protein BGX31_004520 [Mortierella sp. GBA43]|nr:hypothetical protein BGX31_004520 [Mortierella sp. GBA43]